jgi:predicted nucleotidyltransferase
MDKAEVIEKLVEYKHRLAEHFDLDKVILFGSYARGNQNEFSDIDVAVIVKKVEGDFFTYTPILWKLRRDIDVLIEPILFEKDDEDISGFLDTILKEGIEIKD